MGIFDRAIKSICRKKGRSVPVAIVLGLVLAMLISIPPSIEESKAITQQTIDRLVEVSQTANNTMSMMACQIDCRLSKVAIDNFGPNNQTIQQLPLVNATNYANITTLDHVACVIPIFDQTVNNTEFLYSIYGLPLNDSVLFSDYSQLLPSNITSGRNFREADGGVVILHQDVADYFGVGVGGLVRVLNQSFVVVGIDGYSSLNRTAVYMSLDDAWSVTNSTGFVSNLVVFADSVYNVETLAGRISLMFSDLSVGFSSSLVYSFIQLQTQTEAQLVLAQSTMVTIERSGQAELAVVVVVVVLIVLFVMLYTVRERVREVGTLKALGAGHFTVLGQFVLEGMFLSLVAGVIGVMIGTVGASSVANLFLQGPIQAGTSAVSDSGVSLGDASSISISVAITPELVLFGLGAAILLGVLGSLYPAWRASIMCPAESMRQD
ncbi:MAG: FtsX-like permease family protein [Nitrososphaerota archaeon]|jgi:putative ABC transport system permease protein|nr:FtsX-like permease family protein [Nitrososphaerota archaeon]